MKRQLLLFAFAALVSMGAVNAQGGGGQRMTPEERTKVAMEKMEVLNLETGAKTKTEEIIGDFYKVAQKTMDEMRASGSMDREVMMAKRKELADNRDKKLKDVFNAEQFKKWQVEIEPSLRPQRNNPPSQ